MQLPIWMPGLGHVNMYGLVDADGIAVVDPGLPGPQSWKALKARLKSAGYRTKDVHTVVVTHSHPDHFGGAGRLAREANAKIVTHHSFSTWTVKGPSPQRALSEGEARRLEMEAAAVAQAVDVNPDELPTINDPEVVPDDTDEREATSSPWGTVTPWGTTNPGPPLKRRLMIRAMRMLFVSPEPTDRLHHGERMRLAGRDWFVVHTPGHTVDHLCVWDPGDRNAAHGRPRAAVDHAARLGSDQGGLVEVVPRDARPRRRASKVCNSACPRTGIPSPTCPAASRRSRCITRSAWSCCGKPRSGSGRHRCNSSR